ncbi:MAG: ferritin [Candidatus Kapaibacterium sp.]
MIKQEMQEALNEQIMKEMYSSNIYLSMATYFHVKNLNGMANWMRIQAREEMDHAMKIYDYIIDRGGHAKILKIDQPRADWNSPLEIFKAALEHEEYVTDSINKLVDLAQKISDHATNNMLQWFVDEQVEEEATTGEIVDRLELVGEDKGGLFMVDNELKARKYVAPQGE